MISKILKLTFTIIAASIAIGCENPIEPEVKPDEPQKEQYVRAVPTSELKFPDTSSSCTLTIESSSDWDVYDYPKWCTVSPESGKDGDRIVITVNTNNLDTPRKGEVIILGDNVETTIKIYQSERRETDYVDMRFEQQGTTMQYDASSGTLTITYADGDLPEITVGSAVILPSEHLFEIRVIEQIDSNGNTLTLETSKGNMCNLFRNMSFTLSTNPDTRATGADGTPVITPFEIGYIDENGKYIETYSQTKAQIQQSLWVFHKDYNGETIYSGKGGRVWWERCSFDSTLDGILEFEFGESAGDDGELSIGELQKFGYKVHGTFDADLLVRYHWDKNAKFTYDDIVKENILAKKVFKFVVGGIIVPVTVSTDLGQFAEFEVDMSADASGGVRLSIDINGGLSWSRANGISPDYNATASIGIYHPTVQTEASLTGKMSTYPHIILGLYDFVGPWVEPRPYVKEVTKAGARASTDGNTYIGITDDFFCGLDMKFGAELDFGIWDTDIESKIYNVIKDKLYATAPSRISINYPLDKNISITEGESLEVEFLVEANSPITGNYWPYKGIAVVFETESGEISDFFELTDENGLAKVTWKPEYDDRGKPQTLKAKVVDNKGKTIDEVSFEVEVARSFIMNSITYENDYYYFVASNGEGYIRYNMIADISGDTADLKDFQSCGIYVYDRTTDKYYIMKDGLSGVYTNTKVEFPIDYKVNGDFDTVHPSSYYAESNRYDYGTFAIFNDGSTYLSEKISCSVVYDRYPSFSYTSVGNISVTKTGEKKDEYGNTIYKYSGSYPYTYTINGAAWIKSIQGYITGNNWTMSDTGSQYGKEWSPKADSDYSSSSSLNYWSSTDMSHQTYNIITTTSGNVIYSNTLSFGGSPTSPTVYISGRSRTTGSPETNVPYRDNTIDIDTDTAGIQPVNLCDMSFSENILKDNSIHIISSLPEISGN